MSSQENINVLKEELSSASDRLEQVRVLSEYILSQLNAKSAQNTKSSGDVFKEYVKIYKNNPDDVPEIPKNTFSVILSKISSEQGTKINCPGRRQGYYLEELVKKLENIEKDESEEAKTTEEKNKKTQEKDIYPILKEWLFEKDFDRVKDVSSLRANGKWGNPDLVGIKIEDFYGRPEIEITTLEVKLTEDGWEHWIFEAIAHTRFANRSYFAFLYPESLLNKLDSTEIKLYAEHFSIGILVLEINDDSYLKIKEGKPFKVRSEDIRVNEYYQAPHNQTHIKFRKKFLKSLNIFELKNLYDFGEKLE